MPARQRSLIYGRICDADPNPTWLIRAFVADAAATTASLLSTHVNAAPRYNKDSISDNDKVKSAMMRIHGIVDQTAVNGPGNRTTIWTAGCTVACKGCVNPETWDASKGSEMSEKDLLSRILLNRTQHNIDGVSFSGGEPLEQFTSLKSLLALIKQQCPALDILVYTGRLISDIKDYSVLNYIDFLIDGPFIENRKNLDLLWRGSDNQKIYLLNENIKNKMKNYYKLLDESGNLIDRETGAEFTIDTSGEIQLTGFSTMSQRQLKRDM